MKLEEMRVKDLKNYSLKQLLWSELHVHPKSSALVLECFSKIDWTKATDQERLAYCELRYPKGAKFMCLSGWKEQLVSSGTFEVGDKDSCYYGYIHNKYSDAALGCSGIVYLHGKFAEIVQPEEKPVESVEFKEGEMVEGSDNKIYWCDGKFIIKHGDIFIIDTDRGLMKYKYIRKLDPDNELRKLAKEVLNNVKVDKDWVQNLENALIEMAKKVKEGNV